MIIENQLNDCKCKLKQINDDYLRLEDKYKFNIRGNYVLMDHELVSSIHPTTLFDDFVLSSSSSSSLSLSGPSAEENSSEDYINSQLKHFDNEHIIPHNSDVSDAENELYLLYTME